MKLFKALLARALQVKTEQELNTLCADIDRAYQSEKNKSGRKRTALQID